VLPGSQGGGGIANNILGTVVSGLGKFFGGGVGSLLQGGTLASSFGFGSAGAGVAGPLMANGGFFSGIGGGIGSMSSGLAGTFNILSNIASTLSTAFTSTTLGATIATAVTEIGATIATTLTATLDAITLSLLNPVTWIIALVVAAITAIYRIIANNQERPNAKFSGMFEGVSFDETMRQFVPGAINVAIGRKSGIKNSQAGAIADNLQARLKILADQWVGILNIFPDFISEDIQPALDLTNQRLNKNFANLKFSPGGSRSIQQELEALSGPDGLVRFFDAFKPSIAHGFAATLQRGGIGADLTGFQSIDPGFKKLTPEVEKDWADFIAAIKDVAGLTSQLGRVGANKFLTPTDLSGVTSLFDQLFSTSDSATFTKAAAEIQEKLKPITDFLDAAVQESTDLFGRGLLAALDAATASDAQAAFLESLGQGVKEKIFNGIVESFVASAQFSDLLAPIQQTIRDFTQQAIETGQQPDIAAFRSAILPGIESVSARANALAPLIEALQQLGFEFKDALGVFSRDVAEVVTEAKRETKVEINIENYANDSNPEALGRQIAELLGGRVAPPA